MIVKVSLIDWQCWSKVKRFMDDVKEYIKDIEEKPESFPNGVSYSKWYVELDIPKDEWEKIYNKYKDVERYDYYFESCYSMFQNISVKEA